MTSRLRIMMLLTLLVCGAALIGLMLRGHVHSPLTSTLATPFQLLGTPVKLVDRMASRVVPVSALDERDLGDIYRKRYDAQVQPNDPDQIYLDELIGELSKFSHKPFPYRAYAVGSFGAPNAMALPGGVILVTRELPEAMQSESELVSVLAHEMGHIELGHCFDMVRFELLARKVGSQTLGELADISVQVLLRHAFSKTVEDEADTYAYALVVNSQYDPLGVGNSFGSLLRFMRAHGVESQQHAEPFRDYFMSHPPLEIREAKFHEQAVVWWKGHSDARRYVGRKNLKDRTALSVRAISDEFMTDISSSSASAPPSVNATGRWSGHYSSSVFGFQSVSMNLMQNGAEVTGTYSSSSGATGNISGNVSDKYVTFAMSVTTSGCSGGFNGTGMVKDTVTPNILSFSYSGSSSCGGSENGTGNLTKQ